MPDDTEKVSVENRASFLARFELKVSPKDLKLIMLAYNLAKYGHHRDVRDSGERKFEHPRHTVIIATDELGINDPEIVISLLLHDIPEDSFILDVEDITLIFGERVGKIVATLTKPKVDGKRFINKATRDSYYHECIANSDADTIICKLCDQLHNLRTLGSCSQEKQERKVAEMQVYYIPLIKNIREKYPEVANRLGSLFRKATTDIIDTW